MSEIIEDGTGKGYRLKIDSENRAYTKSVTETDQSNASKDGDAYIIGSGVVALTSANESAVLYFKNNEDRDLIITAVNISSDAMTGSSKNVCIAKLYTLATGIGSGGGSTSALNINFGSSKTLNADIKVGAEAATITDGIASAVFYIPTDTFFTTGVAWVIPKGKSLALSITPGANNTSFPISVTVEGHLNGN